MLRHEHIEDQRGTSNEREETNRHDAHRFFATGQTDPPCLPSLGVMQAFPARSYRTYLTKYAG
jgi:hypothetical protein